MILKIKSKLVGLEKIVLPLVLFLSLGGCQSQPAGVSGNSKPVWSVAFSPQGGCTELVVDTLTKAKTEVLVQAYSFTSAPIARALIEAKNRGVKVEVILDKSQRTERYSEADFLAHSGIPVSIDAVHSIAHNKVMVIDDETVITGSFNFTKAAEEHNAENLLVFHDKELAALYKRNWQKHQAHSEPYGGR